jgi:hypothetical protein
MSYTIEYLQSEAAAQGVEISVLVNCLVQDAIRLGASDLHVEPWENAIAVRARVNGVLKIDYDGSDTWYKTMGINITKKPAVVTEGGNKNSCTFASGGNFYMDKLPTLVTSLLNRQIEQISFDFNDNVQLSLTPDDRLAATITVDATGRYYGAGESGGASWSTFNQSGSVIYQGIRKQ